MRVGADEFAECPYTKNDMCWRLLILGIMAVASHGSEPVRASQFYAVSVFFSDHGPSLYYRILDVTQDGPDTVVRYTRIAQANLHCPRLIVHSVDARVPNKTPGELTEANNPCAVEPRALNAAMRKYIRSAGSLETIRFGVVARCGFASVALGLPPVEEKDFERLQKAHPELARLWRLSSDITDRLFGERDSFHHRTEAQEVAMQQAGENLVPDLTSGRYDLGLATAIGRNAESWRSATFRSLLAEYRGPVSAAEARISYVAELSDAQAYEFAHFAVPKYPALAKLARIAGKVKLRLRVETATGRVADVSAVSGHPLLASSATEAARQWQFRPDSIQSEFLNLTVDFALRCP